MSLSAPAKNPASSPRDPFDRVTAGTLGMTVFLVSLSALFAATMAGFVIMLVVMRGQREAFDPDTGGVRTIEEMPELPDLPAILWASTIIILLSSATMQWAKASASRDRRWGLRAGMVLTLALGLAFLALQTLAWLEWKAAVPHVDNDAYRFAASSFYVLSMVHAAHLVGGIVPMLVVTARAFGGRYSAENHAGVKHLALYWHFLDIIWVMMFAIMLIFL